ncbi:MAG: T9SS type A sorting domain-containing protein [Chitinophagaceae bacterium]|nr:T9SS type A sorting domain-containing protein [Chitinophagaceae bacterium]
MKILLLLLSILFLIDPNLNAQPNITDSIYVQEKICHANEVSFADLVVTSTGSAFGLRAIVETVNFTTDYKLYKMNSQFDTLWHVRYGGSQDDYIRSIDVLSDGNLLLVGETNSIDGTLQGVGHAGVANELWVMIVDTTGTILHQYATGGNGSTVPYAVQIAATGDIYIGGSTMADNNDFMHTIGGGLDCFLAKLSSTLQKKWIKCWYGNDVDLIQGVDGGLTANELVLSIGTFSTDSLLGSNGSKGSADGLLMVIDTAGNELWSRRYGGSSGDQLNKTFTDTVNKVYYSVGTLLSIDGDITYKTGDSLWNDYDGNIWVTKVDSLGNVLYSKGYGTRHDSTNNNLNNDLNYKDAIFYNNDIYVLTYTYGGGGDLPYNYDGLAYDTWIAKIDTQCNLRGKMLIGTLKDDYPNCFFYKDKMPYIHGYSGNPANSLPNWFSCDTAANFRYVLGISDAPLNLPNPPEEETETLIVYPNPTNSKLLIKTVLEYNMSEKRLYDSVGNLRISTKSNAIDVSGLPRGVYYLKCGDLTRKVVLN